jgi:hypothetical protein
MCLEDGTNNEEQCSHAHSGDYEGVPATKSLDKEKHEESGCDYFDDTVDTRSEQGVCVTSVSDLSEAALFSLVSGYIKRGIITAVKIWGA